MMKENIYFINSAELDETGDDFDEYEKIEKGEELEYDEEDY